MKDRIEYTGSVTEGGTLRITNRAKFDKELTRFAGKQVEIIVQKKRITRSLPLNKYWWGVVIPLVQERFEQLGNECSNEDVHEYLKGRYHYSEWVDEKTGEVLRLPLSTTRMTNTEFLTLIEKVKEFASTVLDVYIPDPNEDLKLISYPPA